MPSPALYDRIGIGYTATRGEEPRIAQAIREALADARTVLNVGAGTGSYEPHDRTVMAVEPSAVMISQRPSDAAPCVPGHAEALPFPDASFDATMAILTDHHWEDRAVGLRELRRAARHRVVLLTWDPTFRDEFWLTRDYLPASKRLAPAMSIKDVTACLGGARIVPVPIPHDCRDGFYHAFWRRPEAYLDERVRAGISVIARLDPGDSAGMVRRLKADLETGVWQERNSRLLDVEEIDLGYRLLVAELTC
jgi:SAM-dependent methyltransferase